MRDEDTTVLAPRMKSIEAGSGVNGIQNAPVPRDHIRPIECAGKRIQRGVIGRGRVMQTLLAKVRRVANSEATALLQGESGTGKEVIANAIHHLSERSAAPFVKIKCSAIPDALVESELFGHSKGAFTGASTDRMGVFQAAEGGTLLLDEIGEIPLGLQPKLLHVLESGHFSRVGDAGNSRRANVRIIAATNADLQLAVEEGRFRRDLFYRLNVIPLTLPPLRERLEDLPDLVEHLTRDRARTRRGAVIPLPSFSAACLDRMRAYPWPGNVRELANAIEYVLVMSDRDVIEPGDLPESILEGRLVRSPVPSRRLEFETLESMEKRLILSAMSRSDFNQSRAAEMLGINRQALRYRVEKHRLQHELERMREDGAARFEAPNRSQVR
jgi:DNA-binding NtrC family response regulator